MKGMLELLLLFVQKIASTLSTDQVILVDVIIIVMSTNGPFAQVSTLLYASSESNQFHVFFSEGIV